MRSWWARRSLPSRITLTVGVVALVALLGLARLAAGLVGSALTGAVDAELAPRVAAAAAEVAAGQPADRGTRVLDTAGDPVDGDPRPDLDPGDVRRLRAGQPVSTADGAGDPRRWTGQVVTAPDGSQRLVVAAADVVGFAAAVRRGVVSLVVAAVAAALAVAAAAWAAARAALTPVRRLGAAAVALGAGARLPEPVARDEVTALALAINALLARRDEAAQRLARFTADAAHELRSPVAAIRAQAEVAVAHPAPELAEETLREVAGESARLSGLLDDLLELARADAGRRAPARPVDLVAAARDAATRQPARRAPVLRVSAPSPATVLATPGEVGLVLDNLVGNACRHAATVVRVSVLPAGTWVRLLVDDDGPGVPAEHRDRVFDRFYRVEQHRVEQHRVEQHRVEQHRVEQHGGDNGGAGLGLALVAEVVRARGGTVTVGDGPDGGARFEVRWPAALP